MKFVNYNVNPKNKKTGDCVIRAISVALDKEYWEVVEGLMEVYKKTGHIINSKQCFEKYLKNLGYEKQKMPRRLDKTRYNIEQFNREFAKPNTNYIISVARHLTCIKNNELIDIWNCSCKFVGNYWIIKK